MNYSDIWLQPDRQSSVRSRDDIDISSKLGELTLDVPLIAAPMMDVVNSKTASEIYGAGGYAFLHRFHSIDKNLQEYRACPQDIGCSVGISTEEEDRFHALYDAGCRYFCIDVANGANTHVNKQLLRLSQKKNTKFIVGNFCHLNQLEWLRKSRSTVNVVGVRMGVSGGMGCSTKDATGILSTPTDILLGNKSHRHNPPIIADGSIKTPGDLCKAIGMGASFGMAGSIFANCADSPSETVKENGVVYKLYSGSASLSVQQTHREPRYIEGKTVRLEQSQETVKDLMSRYAAGLKSSLSYFGASNLDEFKQHARFIYDNPRS